MERKQRRWLLWTGGSVFCIAGLPLLIWVVLPVRRDPGPIQLRARPSGLLSETFDVEVVNTEDATRRIHKAEMPRLAGQVPIQWRQAEGWNSGPEYEYLRSDRPPILITTQRDFLTGNRGSGLYRTSLTYAGDMDGEVARTDVWMLRIGSIDLAIK